jgi:hypothetical protein
MTREDLLSQPKALAMKVPSPGPRGYTIPVEVQVALDDLRDFFVAQVQEANLDYMVAQTVSCGTAGSPAFGALIYVMRADKSQIACKILLHAAVKTLASGVTVKFLDSVGSCFFDRIIPLGKADTSIIDILVVALADRINRAK